MSETMFCCCTNRGQDRRAGSLPNAMYLKELVAYWNTGAPLIKPVESLLVERHSGDHFRAGVAELNGWRGNMEDAHCALMRDDWGVFGVFDGHGGDLCSRYVAQEMLHRLETSGYPANDEAVKELLFSVDQDFLDSGMPGGCTAAMCILEKPQDCQGTTRRLRVINAGDSRILLGRRDGSIVDGGGTDQALTKDHKPDHPVEWERINRCGGSVVWKGKHGFRLNGDLAVARGFGGSAYKQTGGPGLQDRPFTVDPQLEDVEMNTSDFVVLLSDGIYERGMTSSDVVKVVADVLRETNDPGAAAAAVCRRALNSKSKDNMTAMVVLNEGDGKIGVDVEFTPGPLAALSNNSFMLAWAGMASRAGLSAAAAVEQRYELIEGILKSDDSIGDTSHDRPTLEQEVMSIGRAPGKRGDEERSEWFRNRFARLDSLRRVEIPQQTCGN